MASKNGLQECGEGAPSTDVAADGGVLGVEATYEVEDEGPVGDGLAQVAELVGHGLEAPAVI